MQFCDQKISVLSTAPIHILWYIRNVFDRLKVSKCFFHLKNYLHSCSSDLFQKLTPPIFRSTYSTVFGYMMVFCLSINMVLILRTWRVEKSLLEIYRFNVLPDIGGVLKTHFGYLKLRFMSTAPIHIVRCYETILTVERLVNVFSIWYMIYIRVPLIFFISNHHPNFDQLTRV
jgi:ABC-type uncharacterized transport system permease subunit